MSGSITQMLGQLKSGEADVMLLLWERFVDKLLKAARAKIPAQLYPVADEDDIAQSVFAALWRGMDAGRLSQLANREELWWYLLATTHHKIIDHVRMETAARRGDGRVRSAGSLTAADESAVQLRLQELVSGDPTPEFVLMLDEEHQRLMDLLRDEQLRQIAAWRIEGITIEEIAARLGIALRSVTRKLTLIRKTWANEVE